MQLLGTIGDPAVIEETLAHLGLPGAREGPRPPWPLTAAGAEQPTGPGVSVQAPSGVLGAAAVCSAGSCWSRGGLPRCDSRSRVDL
jgi:hypothetical protein